MKMNSSNSSYPFRVLKDQADYVLSSPTNTATFLIVLPLLTIGVSYLASWMTSSLNKFPGPPLACELNLGFQEKTFN